VTVTSSYFDQVQSAADLVRSRSNVIPHTALVLGSGLGDFAASLERPTSIRYEEIPNWPAAKVIGHEGRMVIGTASDRPVIVLSGRAHFYEGHDLRTVTFATRVLGVLGVKVLILTNAAGGINTSFAPGDLMLIDDHINLLGSNPLVGPNDERFGVRFPDLTNVYSPRLRKLAEEAAASQGLALRHGI
jgi:purine-nucleoside phosphorylase